MLVSSAAMLLASVAFIAYEMLSFRQRMVTDMMALATMVGDNCKGALSFDDPRDAEEVLQALRFKAPIELAVVYNNDGKIFAAYRRDKKGPFPPSGSHEESHNFDNGHLHIWRQITLSGSQIGAVYLQSDLSEMTLFLQHSISALILVILLAFGVAYVLSNRLQRVISTPLHHLADIAGHVSRNGDYSVRAIKQSEDELGLLTDAFNDMLTQIEKRDLALGESEERFRNMVNLLPQPIYEADTQGNLTFTNRAGLDTFGVIAEDIDGMTNVLDFLIPEERERGIDNIQKILRDEMIGPNEYTMSRNDGSTFPAIVHSSPRVKGGEVIGFRGLVIDITEHKQAEEALRKSEEKLSRAFQATPDGVAISRLSDGMLLYVNPGLAKLGKCPVEKIIGQSSLDLKFWANPEDRKELVKKMEEEGEVSNFETEFRPIDGEPFPCSMSASLIEIEGEKYMVSLTRDNTERKQAEKELEKLSRAVEQSPATIVITDSDGKIEYVNPKFTQLTGYSSEEAIGTNPRILKSGKHPPEFYEHLWNTIISGDTWQGEFHNKKKNGELYWESASISPITNEEGAITNFVCVKENITEKRRAEKALQNIAEGASATIG